MASTARDSNLSLATKFFCCSSGELFQRVHVVGLGNVQILELIQQIKKTTSDQN